jgi:hypothetical protein
MAATPSPNYSDQQLLASDATFQNRVRQSLIAACAAIKSESPTTVAFHRERETYLQGIMNAPDTYKIIFAQAVATNASVIGDATVAGATPLTSGNVAAQAALVTDPHIDAAISGLFNSFFRTPAS